MWKAVICDDEKEMRSAIKENLKRFSDETGEQFSIAEYDSGEALLFKHGETIAKYPADRIVEVLLDEIEKTFPT